MGYSKETERQNKVLGDLLTGKEPEKRIMVGYQKVKGKKTDNVSRMTELMQDVRMPLFCKSCDKVMKKKLDDKMWRLYGHCFDCQIKVEHKLRLSGEFDSWEKNKIKQNKISFLKDQIQAIKEWVDKKAPEFYNQVGVNYPELEKEKWGGDMTQINLMAKEALEEYEKVLNELEKSE